IVPCDVLVPRAKATFVSPDGGVAQLGATVTATVTAATTLASPTLSSAHLTARFMPSSKPRSPAGLEGDRPVEDDGRYGTGTHGGELVPAPGRAVEGPVPPVIWKAVSMRRPCMAQSSWCEWVEIVPLSKMNAPGSSTMLQVPPGEKSAVMVAWKE